MAHTRRKTSPLRVFVAALLSVLAHGAAGSALYVLGAFDPLTLPKTLTLRMDDPHSGAEGEAPPMEIESLVQELDRPDQKTAEEERRQKEVEATKAEGQVVDIAKPSVEVRPDEARYLAEYDSKVLHETKGKTGREQAGATTPPVPPQPSVAPVPPGRPGALGPLAMRAKEAQRPSESDPRELGPDGSLAPRRPGSGLTPRHEDRGGGGLPGGRPQPNLFSQEPLLKAMGMGAGSMDYLQDLDDGESTALSAKKWKFASFFNRLKRQVGDEWHPDTVYVRHDPSGNIYGVKDRVTVLRVHLLQNGKIAGMQVLRPSGVDFLDDEAVAAFKRAQPFMNPPPQLVESDGQIHFNFAFIFELSGKASFRVFKY